jgi:hypothetical protein
MYLRCPRCGACTRVPLENMVDSTVNCARCGERHSTAGAGALGSTPESREQTALVFAKENHIDLASAYSVLLGVMPINRAFSIHGEDPVEPTQRVRPVAVAEPTPVSEIYDVNFASAVSDRLLTVRQAAERGDRELYASKLARRHGLSMDRAYLVADNRLRLDEALRQNAAAAERGAVPPETASFFGSRLGIACAIAVACSICVGIGWRLGVGSGGGHDGIQTIAALHSTTETKSASTVTPSTAATRVNAVGQPLAIKARDPESVLSAFCSSSNGPTFGTPERVVRFGDDYVGYYSKGGVRYALPIHREGDGYAAGTESDPIQPAEASAVNVRR